MAYLLYVLIVLMNFDLRIASSNIICGQMKWLKDFRKQIILMANDDKFLKHKQLYVKELVPIQFLVIIGLSAQQYYLYDYSVSRSKYILKNNLYTNFLNNMKPILKRDPNSIYKFFNSIRKSTGYASIMHPTLLKLICLEIFLRQRILIGFGYRFRIVECEK